MHKFGPDNLSNLAAELNSTPVQWPDKEFGYILIEGVLPILFPNWLHIQNPLAIFPPNEQSIEIYHTWKRILNEKPKDTSGREYSRLPFFLKVQQCRTERGNFELFDPITELFKFFARTNNIDYQSFLSNSEAVAIMDYILKTPTLRSEFEAQLINSQASVSSQDQLMYRAKQLLRYISIENPTIFFIDDDFDSSPVNCILFTDIDSFPLTPSLLAKALSQLTNHGLLIVGPQDYGVFAGCRVFQKQEAGNYVRVGKTRSEETDTFIEIFSYKSLNHRSRYA